jgi:hypothetical protein
MAWQIGQWGGGSVEKPTGTYAVFEMKLFHGRMPFDKKQLLLQHTFICGHFQAARHDDLGQLIFSFM